MASDHRARGRLPVRPLLILLVALLIAAPFGQAGARRALQMAFQSPATGGAQVTTQGIAELPDGQIVYRVVKRTAPRRGGAKVGRRVLSIVLATDDPVLLSNERADGTIEDVARVAPGESYLVQAGTRQIRAGLGDRSVEYLAVEVVQESSGPDIGNGELLFLSDPFLAPDGPRDIDFLRNILAENETGLVPDSGQTVAILATDGAIDILPANGTPTTLQAGESAIFPAGDLEISVATVTANGVPVNQLAGLTSSLQAGSGDAAYVVTVIGEEVPPTDAPPTTEPAPQEPTPRPRTQATAVPTAKAEPDVTGNGTIGVSGFLCPATSAETLDPAACKPTADNFGARITAGETDLDLDDAIPSATGYFWIGVPLTTYSLTVDPLPDGYGAYSVPDSAAVGGSAARGYTITVDPTSPAVTVPIYFLASSGEQGQPTAQGTITVVLSECAGYDQAAGASGCEPVPAGSPNQPYLLNERAGTRHDVTAAATDGNVYSWSGLPAGDYQVLQTEWPYDMVVNGSYYPANASYGVILQEEPLEIIIDDIRPPVITSAGPLA